MSGMILKYRLDEFISKRVNKSETKKELAKALNISRKRLNTLCRAKWSDNVNIKTNQLWIAAAFFNVEVGELLNPPEFINKGLRLTIDAKTQAA